MAEWTYSNDVILAPMVRVGTLPMRHLALKYGATKVYGEEIIDKKIITSTRVELSPTASRVVGDTSHENLKPTVDYLIKDSICFQTIPDEPVVFQVGTADAVLALKAAEHVARDVRAIDVNMGCPKHFSISGGMGAALLTKPEVAEDILKTLVRNLSIPVTCKIRIFPELQDTIQFVKRMEACGIKAIGIHGREREDRSTFSADWDHIASVVEHASVPVIHNADVFLYEDINRARQHTGTSNVMVARGAMWNASMFRKEGILPVFDVMNEYITVAKQYRGSLKNTKYTLDQMLKLHGKGKGRLAGNPSAIQMRRAKSLDALELEMQGLKLDPFLSGDYVPPIVLADRAFRPNKRSCEVPDSPQASKRIK